MNPLPNQATSPAELYRALLKSHHSVASVASDQEKRLWLEKTVLLMLYFKPNELASTSSKRLRLLIKQHLLPLKKRIHKEGNPEQIAFYNRVAATFNQCLDIDRDSAENKLPSIDSEKSSAASNLGQRIAFKIGASLRRIVNAICRIWRSFTRFCFGWCQKSLSADKQRAKQAAKQAELQSLIERTFKNQTSSSNQAHPFQKQPSSLSLAKQMSHSAAQPHLALPLELAQSLNYLKPFYNASQLVTSGIADKAIDYIKEVWQSVGLVDKEGAKSSEKAKELIDQLLEKGNRLIDLIVTHSLRQDNFLQQLEAHHIVSNEEVQPFLQRALDFFLDLENGNPADVMAKLKGREVSFDPQAMPFLLDWLFAKDEKQSFENYFESKKRVDISKERCEEMAKVLFKSLVSAHAETALKNAVNLIFNADNSIKEFIEKNNHIIASELLNWADGQIPKGKDYEKLTFNLLQKLNEHSTEVAKIHKENNSKESPVLTEGLPGIEAIQGLKNGEKGVSLNECFAVGGLDPLVGKIYQWLSSSSDFKSLKASIFIPADIEKLLGDLEGFLNYLIPSGMNEGFNLSKDFILQQVPEHILAPLFDYYFKKGISWGLERIFIQLSQKEAIHQLVVTTAIPAAIEMALLFVIESELESNRAKWLKEKKDLGLKGKDFSQEIENLARDFCKELKELEPFKLVQEKEMLPQFVQEKETLPANCKFDNWLLEKVKPLIENLGREIDEQKVASKEFSSLYQSLFNVLLKEIGELSTLANGGAKLITWWKGLYKEIDKATQIYTHSHEGLFSKIKAVVEQAEKEGTFTSLLNRSSAEAKESHSGSSNAKPSIVEAEQKRKESFAKLALLLTKLANYECKKGSSSWFIRIGSCLNEPAFLGKNGSHLAEVLNRTYEGLFSDERINFTRVYCLLDTLLSGLEKKETGQKQVAEAEVNIAVEVPLETAAFTVEAIVEPSTDSIEKQSEEASSETRVEANQEPRP